MFHDSSAFTAAGTLNLWVQRHGEQHACILREEENLGGVQMSEDKQN